VLWLIGREKTEGGEVKRRRNSLHDAKLNQVSESRSSQAEPEAEGDNAVFL